MSNDDYPTDDKYGNNFLLLPIACDDCRKSMKHVRVAVGGMQELEAHNCLKVKYKKVIFFSKISSHACLRRLTNSTLTHLESDVSHNQNFFRFLKFSDEGRPRAENFEG